MPRSSKTGFTLVEAIVAVAIGATVLVLLFSIFAGIQNGVGRTVAGISARDDVEYAATRLRRDLNCAGQADREDEKLFRMVQDADGHLVELRFVTALPSAEADAPIERFMMADVVYQRVNLAPQRYAFDRSVRLYGAEGEGDGFETERLPGPFSSIEMEVYDGERWTRNWSEPARLPDAYRLAIHAGEDDSTTRRVHGIIASAHRFVLPRDERADARIDPDPGP